MVSEEVFRIEHQQAGYPYAELAVSGNQWLQLLSCKVPVLKSHPGSEFGGHGIFLIPVQSWPPQRRVNQYYMIIGVLWRREAAVAGLFASLPRYQRVR